MKLNDPKPIKPGALQSFGIKVDLGGLDFTPRAKEQEAQSCDVDWTPFEGKPQEEAYNSFADEMYYGGAAGGGKTDLDIGLAATRHKRSLILRRHKENLSGVVDRSKEIIGAAGKYNEVYKTWKLNNGAKIQLGGCQYERDREKYQGIPFDLICFDEAPQFTANIVRFISAWARSKDPNQRVRVMLTGNPPMTAEGYWILERYAPWLDPKHPNPAQPGELRWYAMENDVEVERPDGEKYFFTDASGITEEIKPKSRTFIPSRVQDNPVYMESGYEHQLQALPEPLRSQLLYGDMTVGHDDDPMQVIPTAWVRAAQARWKARQHDGPFAEGIGVDVARGGKDKTVIARREDAWFDELLKYPGASTPDGPYVAGLVIPHIKPEFTSVSIDATGVGSSVYDQLRQAALCSVTGVINAEKSDATDRSGRLGMVNVRAAQYWAFREALDPELGDGLELPPDPELIADLTAPKWKLTPRGIQIEAKDDIIDRLGRSPDCGDAIVMALAARPVVIASARIDVPDAWSGYRANKGTW